MLKLEAFHCPKLTEIDVSGSELRLLDLSNDEALTDAVLDAVLANQTKLKVLNVKGCSNVSFPEVRSANHRYPIKLLQAVDVEKIHRVEPAIVDLLRQSLQTLNLLYNNIGAAGGIAIAAALPSNTTLQTLNLRDSKIREAGGSAIGKALESNTTLQTLNLRYLLQMSG